jgi:hypothetical protein
MSPLLSSRRFQFTALSILALFLVLSGDSSAQSFTADARTVGMGGGGKSANISLSMVDPAAPYAVIPIPLGLIQVLNNLRGFDPSNDKFDPAWAVEAASNPLHYTFGRKSSGSDSPEARFMRDLVNGEINRDLATYSSFHIPDAVDAEGLASPAFGATIKFAKRPSGAFQGLFVGAGPYLSFGTDAAFDPRITDILENGSHYPNSSLLVQDASRIQLAMSVVVGYRTRLEMPGWSGDRDGVYVAANYRYLRGFKYLQPDTTIRFDTDAAGLVTVNPATTPFVVADLEADKGTGRAVDIGVQVVRGGWEGGFGVNGIGNRIEWTDLTLKRYTLNSLSAGGDFVEQTISNPPGPLTVELPIVSSGNVGYDGGGYAFKASVVHGFNGNSFHGGAEKTLGPLAVRGGARYSRDHWDPTWGFGVGRRVGLDVGFYGSHWNLEEKRQISMAVSIRIGRSR